MDKPPMQGDLLFGFIMGFLTGMVLAAAIFYFLFPTIMGWLK